MSHLKSASIQKLLSVLKPFYWYIITQSICSYIKNKWSQTLFLVIIQFVMKLVLSYWFTQFNLLSHLFFPWMENIPLLYNCLMELFRVKYFYKLWSGKDSVLLCLIFWLFIEGCYYSDIRFVLRSSHFPLRHSVFTLQSLPQHATLFVLFLLRPCCFCFKSYWGWAVL